jgi:alpha-mannosidase
MKKRNRSGGYGQITRRSFISKAAAGTAGMVIIPAIRSVDRKLEPVKKWPSDSEKYKFHLIGHAHIDPVWLWPWQEGMAVVLSTFRSALDRMRENPDFTFTASSAQFYQWIEENDPGMLYEIRLRVNEGRWSVAGGWWVEPDMNIPCGESMVRQGLYGQLTFRKLLGRQSDVAFNPDSFGHTSTLPQLLKLQGIENYVFMRPAPHEKNIHDDLFWWKGVDGTKVLTYRIPISYNDTGSVRERVEQVLDRLKDQPLKTAMTFYGAGDHGGGATKENIISIMSIKEEEYAPELKFSTPERFFKEIRNDKNIPVGVISDDLQHHAAGCYTAESEIKKGNRSTETALITAEKITSIGSIVWGFEYPGNEFTKAWKRLLFLQFHDSLAGTSLPEHSTVAREGFGFAKDIAHTYMYRALQKLEWKIPAEDPESQYMVAFNPQAWDVTNIIEYDLSWDNEEQSVVEDENGNAFEHQWTAGSTETGNRKRLVSKVVLPAFGYRQIRIRKGQRTKMMVPVIVSDNSMENEFLRIRFTRNGTIGIFDKSAGREVFKSPDSGCRGVIIDDPSDTWSHDIKSFSGEDGSFGNAEIIFIEDGPLRAIARMKSKYGNSILTTDWIIYAGLKHIESRVTLDWHEHLKMLKFSFPVNVESTKATFETPYGTIERETNGNEEPGQRWIDISGAQSGLTIINDAKYGYSVNGNDLRISIARSAVYAHHNPRKLDMKSEHIWQDQGIQTFRMLIVPHEGKWQDAKIPRIAEEFLQPTPVIFQGIHKGKFPRSGSLLSIDPENVIISALKKSEAGDDLIMRCVETSGMHSSANVNLVFANQRWNGTFRPFEIKTLRYDSKNGKITEVNLLEE